MLDFHHLSQLNKGIIFIPDIRGFTDFVSKVEVSHSQHIVSELLELIIDEIQGDFLVSEIEGDAVLSYRFDENIDIEKLVALCENIFVKFHSHLKNYSKNRICQCGSCSTADQLGLKFIFHIGKFGLHKISDREKLYGKEVILAHRLLKNDFPFSEYILLSSSDQKVEHAAFESFEKAVEGFGIHQLYIFNLAPFKDNIPDPPKRTMKYIPEIDSMIFESISDTPFQEIILAITEPEQRIRWMKNVTKIKLKGHKINRINSDHECIINGNSMEVTLEEMVSNDHEVKIIEHAVMRSPRLEMFQLFTITRITDNKIIIGMGTSLIPGKNPIVNFLKPLIEWYFSNQNATKLRGLSDYIRQMNELGTSLDPQFSKQMNVF